MRIDPFAVEQWMDAHEARAQHNCGETCVDSVTIEVGRGSRGRLLWAGACGGSCPGARPDYA